MEIGPMHSGVMWVECPISIGRMASPTVYRPKPGGNWSTGTTRRRDGGAPVVTQAAARMPFGNIEERHGKSRCSGQHECSPESPGGLSDSELLTPSGSRHNAVFHVGVPDLFE